MSDTPAWLKAMENGGLGEARAKAFLMDRFWVLERSVDIEGADYLIQRKLTERNFMDHDPPRLGVVQVKFIQDGGTGLSLNKNYVCDAHGTPYGEFFLLVLTGREDKKRSYLLSAAEVMREFAERIDDDGRVLLRSGGAKLMATSNYEILQEKRALDRIERALADADFYLNRRFLGGTSYLKISPEHIDADLLAPLDNPYGNLQELFFQEKQRVQSILWNMEELTDAMHKMLASTDPEEAFRLYEEAIAGHVGGDRRITFSGNFFRDSDFADAVKRHRFKLSRLRELGVEDAFFKLLETYAEKLTHWLTQFDLDASAAAVRVTATYDVDTLRDPAVLLVAEDTAHRTPHVEHSKRGQQVLYLDLKRLKREIAQTGVEKARGDIVKELLWMFTRPFESALDEIYIGDSR